MQLLDNIVPQTAALKVPAIPSNDQLRRPQNRPFLEILQRRDQEKIAQKVGRARRFQKHSTQIPSSINQYALKVHSSDTIMPQNLALKVPAIPSNGQFRKDTKIGRFFQILQRGDQAKIAQKVGRTRWLQKHPAGNSILN